MSDRYLGITPYLFYDNVEAALEWYGRYFNFEEIGRWTDEHGRIHNAEMKAGNSEIWLDGSGTFNSNDERPIWVGV